MKVSELEAKLGLAPTHELQPGKKYLVPVPSNWPADKLIETMNWLDACYGLTVILLPVDDVRLFEIEP